MGGVDEKPDGGVPPGPSSVDSSGSHRLAQLRRTSWPGAAPRPTAATSGPPPAAQPPSRKQPTFCRLCVRLCVCVVGEGLAAEPAKRGRGAPLRAPPGVGWVRLRRREVDRTGQQGDAHGLACCCVRAHREGSAGCAPLRVSNATRCVRCRCCTHAGSHHAPKDGAACPGVSLLLGGVQPKYRTPE